MTVITALVEVRSNKRNEFLNIMKEVAQKTVGNFQCERFEIYQSIENDNVFSFFGSWTSPEGFQKHLKSDHFALILIGLKLLKKNPDIRYFSNPKAVGINSLREMRNIRYQEI